MTSWHTGNLIRSLTSLEGDMLRNCRHVLSRTLSGCAKPVGDGREHRRTYRCTLKGCEGCFVIRRARIPILITGSARPRPDMMRLGVHKRTAWFSHEFQGSWSLRLRHWSRDHIDTRRAYLGGAIRDPLRGLQTRHDEGRDCCILPATAGHVQTALRLGRRTLYKG